MISQRRICLVPGIPHIFPHPHGMAGCHRNFGRKPWMCWGLVWLTGDKVSATGFTPKEALEAWNLAAHLNVQYHVRYERQQNPFIQFTLSRGRLPWWA